MRESALSVKMQLKFQCNKGRQYLLELEFKRNLGRLETDKAAHDIVHDEIMKQTQSVKHDKRETVKEYEIGNRDRQTFK
jgi:hypothetical protein